MRASAHGQQGATLVEFALVSLTLFALVGALFDFGMLLLDYNMLTYFTDTIARKTAATEKDLATGNGFCAGIKGDLHTSRKEIMENQFNITKINAWPEGAPDPYYFTVIRPTLDPADPNPDYFLRVRMRRSMKCFFCLFYSTVIGQHYLEATSTQLLENWQFAAKGAPLANERCPLTDF